MKIRYQNNNTVWLSTLGALILFVLACVMMAGCALHLHYGEVYNCDKQKINSGLVITFPETEKDNAE